VQPIVTALRERPRGRVAIELDGAPWRVVPTDAVVRAGLRVGFALDEQQLDRELERTAALARAARALRHSERSRASVANRLAAAGVGAEVTGEVLRTLERAGLVDDRRFASVRAAHLAAKGWGDEAIRADLEREGVTAELAGEALAALEPERERAQALAGRRGADARTARWLAGRGFDPASIEDAVGGFAEGT
jgi:SOS response regulatory protein OraA/RecX